MALSLSKHHKILALSKEKCLLEIGVPKGPCKVLDSYNYDSIRGCSCSQPIDNRYIFVLGGESVEVFYHDLNDRKQYQGPPIHFRKWHPNLIILGPKLFAFSRVRGISEDPEDLEPICEVLDTSSLPWEWCILNSLPKLPYPQPRGIASYIVVSYATRSSSIFLSLGNEKCSVTYCYDDDLERWSNFSQTRLPFVGEGKFVGPVCYAFPRNDLSVDNSSYLVSYHLTIDWKTDAKVYCFELCRYFLPSTSPFQHPSRLYSFYAMGLNLFTILRTKFSARTSSNPVKRHFLEVDVVLLLPRSLPSPPPSLPPSPIESPLPSQPPSLPLSPLQSLHPESSSQRNSSTSTSGSYLSRIKQALRPVPSSSSSSSSSSSEPNVIEGFRSSRVLKHTSICLPHALEEFLGEYN